jgi:2-keto-myo-inositol isomerase
MEAIWHTMNCLSSSEAAEGMTKPARRQFLAAGGAAALACAPGPRLVAASDGSAEFRYCLNLATLQGYKLDLVQLVEIAAKAGYQAIEPWLSLINTYVNGGGSLPDLRKRIADRGLTVESAIAFPQWMVDDPAKRASGLEQARREMDIVARIGGKRIAAPPAGANSGAEIG